jgi:polyisoprenoid-binding protein YceI
VMRNSDWFDTDAHPKASYVSSADCALANGALTCPGQLTVRGKTLAVPLTLEIAADGAILGKASMDRRSFGIGKGEWEEMGVIGHQVEVKFSINAQPKK